MKTKLYKFITVATFQIGVNIIGLPELFDLKFPISAVVKSLFHK